jgi:hypothetical protein
MFSDIVFVIFPAKVTLTYLMLAMLFVIKMLRLLVGTVLSVMAQASMHVLCYPVVVTEVYGRKPR